MAILQELPGGAVFIGPNCPTGTRYRVEVPAFADENGFVQVWNLSMSDARAAELLATPGAVEPGCDPRQGFFAFSYPVEVELVEVAS